MDNKSENKEVQIILAQSILGLKPTGVEKLGDALLANGLQDKLKTQLSVIEIPNLNSLYKNTRDKESNCLNTEALCTFSKSLANVVASTIDDQRFPFVLGGDCSILLGTMAGLKSKGTYGLVFLDAHADFYQPEKSITGEVADMDLAIVTGRGPNQLTNINGLHPYVRDEYVVHIGQRDWEETKKYGSKDIRETTIKCFSLEDIEASTIETICNKVADHIAKLNTDGFWIHFDADVLSDQLNPAVDYRLAGGLSFYQIEYLISNLLSTGKITGISVTIYNPSLDTDGKIGRSITKTFSAAFQSTINN